MSWIKGDVNMLVMFFYVFLFVVFYISIIYEKLDFFYKILMKDSLFIEGVKIEFFK